MPDLTQYKESFGLKMGLSIGGFRLAKIDIKHVELVRNQEYEYPTRLEFVPISGEKQELSILKSEFQKQVHDDRVIYSRYGNPYLCNFEFLRWNVYTNSIIVESVGTGRRIYDSMNPKFIPHY